jgi:iron complex outermembrane receptor protein
MLDLGPVGLTAITSYTDRNILVLRDISTLVGSVTIDQGLPVAAARIPASLYDRTKVDQFTQEVRLASQNEGPLAWVVGGFYARTKRAYTQNAFVPGYDGSVYARFGAGRSAMLANGVTGVDNPLSLNLPSTLRQYSVFAEGSYHIADVLHLTAGARCFDYRDTNLYQAGGLFSTIGNVRQKTKSDGVAPRFIIAYDLSSDIKVNLQASKGFRLGGVNNPLKVGTCSPQDAATFGPYQSNGSETLWNFEGEVKSRFGPVRLNVATFYSRIRNLHVTLDTGSCSQRFIFNVPKAHTKGSSSSCPRHRPRGSI